MTAKQEFYRAIELLNLPAPEQTRLKNLVDDYFAKSVDGYINPIELFREVSAVLNNCLVNLQQALDRVEAEQCPDCGSYLECPDCE